MGDPRRLKKKYKTPNKLWDKNRLEEELRLIGEYGLRNKREIWKHRTFLSRIRQQGREIQAAPPELQAEPKEKLVARAHRLGILAPEQDSVDDVLNLSLKDICDRRLQTFVHKIGMVKTIHQARQLITHKHIAIDGQVISSPGHLITRSQQALIDYAPGSPFSKADHPVRQNIKETMGDGRHATYEEGASE